MPLLTGIRARIVPAAMLNDAGIVGAAMHAHPGPPGTSAAAPWPLTAGPGAGTGQGSQRTV